MSNYFKVVGDYGYTEKEIEFNKTQAAWMLLNKDANGYRFRRFRSHGKNVSSRLSIYLCGLAVGSLSKVLISEFRSISLESRYGLPINEFHSGSEHRYLLRIKYLEHVAKHGTIPTRRTVKTWALKTHY